MKIIVCVKEIVNDKGNRISILNNENSNAIEAALEIKDEIPDTNVVALAVGSKHTIEILQDCLSMGADNAILVCDNAINDSDIWSTALAFSAAIKKIGKFDFVIASRQIVENNIVNLASIIAEKLDIPQFSYVCGLDIDTQMNNIAKIKGRVSDGYDEFEVKLPCFLTVLKELNEPRYMTCAGIINAINTEIKVWSLDDIDTKKSFINAIEAQTKPVFEFELNKRKKGVKLKNDNPQKVAEELLTYLKGSHIV